MKWKHYLKTAAGGLLVHKSRSVLTILGIVIGIAAIIMISSLGEGANQLILREIQAMGSRTLVVTPGKEPRGPSNINSLFLDALKERELKALQDQSKVPSVVDATPMIIVPGSVSYGGETYDPTTMGSSENFAELMDVYPNPGRFFNAEEVRQNESVAIIGSEVKNKLFGPSEGLGAKIKIRGRYFRVIGIFPQTGSSIFFNMDDLIVIPYTTGQRYLLGTDHFFEIIVRAQSEALVPRAVAEIEATLRETQGITDPEKDYFHIHTQIDLADRVGLVGTILTLLLSSIAAISLLVGGIGIMNIMLVSVTERTREIGLRKAIGATEKNIMTQFVLEAILLTGLGGIIGTTLGITASFIIGQLIRRFGGLEWVFSIPIASALVGITLSCLIGLIFGIFPARSAAKKNPIEALRYE
ncbi:MAG: Efflux ABC transporter, permease protein [Parcubacteria group bacterium Gr01-1014_18]|nr:MAG: Efflux ABC transporter, permease protein [Parcubacteria group bacterium Greene0416_36]TSC81547.1 MAG: Efflux ABC transporter, permease protein [Parcubacteria group bacterium Gr01-1014_18]TSC99642.1 MAG: Efflux ABC transporter, permease protein [Parcubacteria group bacterium Greene1014_20]TSD07093.1 MAG: Efflux ABC transporter, permease protein [Parcubacteria group bacterium Greene0714_2]